MLKKLPGIEVNIMVLAAFLAPHHWNFPELPFYSVYSQLHLCIVCTLMKFY